MIDRSDWEAVYRDLVRDERERLGELPSVDELVAFTKGALPETRAERVREILSVYPDLARELGQTLPEPRPGEWDYATDSEIAEGWAALQSKLHGITTATGLSPRRREPQRRYIGFPLATLAASILAIVLGTLYWGAHRQVEKLEADLHMPRANPEHRLLLPDGHRGGESETPILLSSAQDSFLLRPALIDQPVYPDYRLRIIQVVNDQQREVWSERGLQPLLDDTFEIWMPQTFLRSGDLRLELFGISETNAEDLLATYSIRLTEPQSLP